MIAKSEESKYRTLRGIRPGVFLNVRSKHGATWKPLAYTEQAGGHRPPEQHTEINAKNATNSRFYVSGEQVPIAKQETQKGQDLRKRPGALR